MNVTFLNASALSQYATSLLDQRSEEAASPLSSILATPPLDLSGIDMQAIQAESQHGLKGQMTQQRLGRQQAELGKALLAGLAGQGTALSQEISFSVGTDGVLSVTGTTADVEKVQSFFNRDTTQPSLHDRLSGLLQSTQTLSTTAQTSNATAMAAKYAGSGSNVTALYSQLMTYQGDASARLTVSAQGSSLSYAGMFNSMA